MCFADKHSLPRRPAFTLIELLVVLGIMILLAGLAVAFVPSMAEAERAARGADRLQGWLLIARQQAKRDGVPSGIRLNPGTLYPNTASPNAAYVTDLQYIQKPADFYQPGSMLAFTVGSYVIAANGVDFTAGFSNPQLYPVQPGDYLELQGGGFLHQIDPTNPTSVTANSLSLLQDGFPFKATGTTGTYRIIRSPRILAGESTLQLPQNVAIDATTNTTYSNPLPSGPGGASDIVFSPTGAVLGTANDKIILWVRDVTQDITSPGTTPSQQTLVTIYCRTGFIAAQQVDTTSGNPYSFTQDGRSSGM